MTTILNFSETTTATSIALESDRSMTTTPSKPRILLADDDRGVREMLGRVLESESYEVVYAKTGREAAHFFSTRRPDLVLLDLNMPDKDGWEAFALMCEQDSMVPVIVITARPGQHIQAIDLGIDAFMEKPLDLEVLLKTIATFLAESDSDRARRLTNPKFKTKFLNAPDPPRRPDQPTQ